MSRSIGSPLLAIAIAATIAMCSTAGAESSDLAHLEVAGGAIDVTFAPGRIDLPRDKVLAWISTAARAVAAYYGRFPVTHERIIVIPVDGQSGVLHGTSFGYGGARTKVWLGQHATQAELSDDWIMTHELVHLAFPSVSEDHHWMEEGIATYVEPVARAEIGQLSAERVWGDLVEGLPNGLPAPGDRGLDHTPTWGRTYWGGALFCMLADVEIRRRTQNRYGLQDALRAIVAAGGNIETEWPLTRAFTIGDNATGVPVLMELYDQMKATPTDPDLNDLWHKLGVEVRAHKVTFNDRAALAAARRAITAPSAPDGHPIAPTEAKQIREAPPG